MFIRIVLSSIVFACLKVSLLHALQSGRVEISPWPPFAGDRITIKYNPAGSPLSGARVIKLHWGINGWQVPPRNLWPNESVPFPDNKAIDSPMVRDGEGCYSITLAVSKKVHLINLLFTDGNQWDNNNKMDWVVGILASGLRGKLPKFSEYGRTFDVRTIANLEIHWMKSMFPEASPEGIIFRFPDTGYQPELTGDFWNWRSFAKLKKDKSEYHASISLPDGVYRYKFRLPIGWLPDPNNPEFEDDNFAGFNSILRVTDGKTEPPKEQIFFDRRSESRNLIFYWRSVEFIESEVLKVIERSENILSCLKDYLHAKQIVGAITIYYRKAVSQNAGGVTVGDKIWIARPVLDLFSITHELAHVLRMGSNTVLSEGLATFIEFTYNGQLSPLHLTIRDSILNKSYIPVSQRMHADFINDPKVALLYSESGSFIAYLVEKYGMKKVLRVYIKESFDRVFGKSVSQLEEEWKNWLMAYEQN